MTDETSSNSDSEPPVEAEDSRQREEWVYLGPSHKPGTYLWRDPSGQRLAYGKLKARVFGGIYAVMVNRSDPDNARVSVDVSYTGRRAEDAGAIEVRALENETEVASTRLERSASRTATVDAALIELLDIARKMKTESDRYALAKLVSNRIIGAR